ncbi:MAG: hypothetical protein HZB10_01225 [Candidatus Yonathbacteria bacterium]|nr:hypothetical protein [Candidatus Yonathbacteria bacterium]
MKRFLALMILLGFIGSAILSFSAMKHNMDGVMDGNCPIASTCSAGTAGTLAMASHYLSMYQAFTSGLVSSIVTQVLMVAFLFVALAHVLRIYFTPQLFVLSRNFNAKLYRPQAFTRWLSLLVNSPSLD